MSYQTIEESQQGAAPVQLYQFNRGGATWRYVALPKTFTALGYDWTPEAIGCGNINASGDVPKDAISITLPISNAMAAAFLAYAPDQVTSVTVFRTHYDDPTNGLVIWKGRVLSTPTHIATVTLNCEPVFVSLRRMGLRQTYQRTCRHMLFGPGCNVDPAVYETSITVTAVDGVTITASSITGDFIGGTIKGSDGTKRMIVGQASNVLTIMRPVLALYQDMQDFPSGFTAYLYPGCNKSTDACRDTFHNLGNFGGFPGITGINPFAGTSNVF